MRVAFKEYNEILGIIKGAYHEAAVKTGLSDSELDMFYVLSAYPEGCNQSVLYHESGHTKSTINSALKKMEKKGYLQIRQGQGRNTRVSVTEEGHRLMEQTAYPVIALENEIYDSWTKEEQELFVRMNRDYAEKFAAKVRTWKKGLALR